jgi:hypothetical protein
MSIKRPCFNRTTDYFGFHRHWGKNTWHPDAGYSPIHEGVDYSAAPHSDIVAPVDCVAWGDYNRRDDRIPEAVGSYVMMRPIRSDGEISKYIALYFFHCKATPNRWTEYKQDAVMTQHAGHGIGAPHLHFSIAVAEGLGKELIARGILQEEGVKQKEWELKAKFAKIDERKALQNIRHQVNIWAIRGVYKDYFIRVGLPQYRKSQYSDVGIGLTYMIDPTLFVGQ